MFTSNLLTEIINDLQKAEDSLRFAALADLDQAEFCVMHGCCQEEIDELVTDAKQYIKLADDLKTLRKEKKAMLDSGYF